ncbi:MAG: sensor histidine kinase [Rhizomicrobium sp.]
MSVARIEPTAHALPADLLRETNHRISNHLTLLAGMIQTHASAVARGPETLPREAARSILQEVAGKVIGVGHLHRRLSDRPGDQGIHVCEYLIGSCTALISSLALGERAYVVQHLTADCLISPDQAQKIGLLVNEIVMNAVKHAHPTGLPVQIAIGCRRESSGRFTIEVGDDGVGLPEGSDAATTGGVGIGLIRSLAQSLKADLRIESDSLGLTFLLMLPAPMHAVATDAR